MFIRYCLKGLFFLIPILFSVGSPAIAMDNELSRLNSRAVKLWEAREHGDWGTVYDILAKEESSDITSREDFIEFRNAKGPLSYFATKVRDIAVENELGWVSVKYTVKPLSFPDFTKKEVEKWELWFKSNEWHPIPSAVVNQFPSLPPKLRSAKQERLLKGRISEFWSAFTKKDFSKAYEYFEPKFRTHVKKDQFEGGGSVSLYLGYNVDWVEVIGEKGRAKVSYTYKIDDPSMAKLDPKTVTIFEEWMNKDGEWYRKVKPKQGKN